MLMNGIVNLATTIPSAPGYVGTFDAPGIAVLEAYGVEHALASRLHAGAARRAVAADHAAGRVLPGARRASSWGEALTARIGEDAASMKNRDHRRRARRPGRRLRPDAQPATR